jgi:cytoskeletal protein RodZ
MGSFGPALQRERQQRGIALDDVARDTRLARRYLLALENESLADLPGGLYNRAYVRTYANYLGLDADRLVRDYDLEAHTLSEAGRLVVPPDAVAAMRVAVQHRASQPGGKAAFGTILHVRALSGAAFVALVGTIWTIWLAGSYFTQRAEPVPVGASRPATVAVSGGHEPIDVAAWTSESPHRTDPAPPRPEPAAGGNGAATARLDDVPATPLSVDRSGVGTDVVDRQLVGQSDRFAVGTRVAFWTRVTGGRPGETVRHVWIREGRLVATVALPIGSTSWRTQSQRTLAPEAEGDWVVEARDLGGRVLARHEFRCVP